MTARTAFAKGATLLRDSLPLRWQVPIKFWVNSIQRNIEPELQLLPYVLHQGHLAVDIGANRGIYTYMLSRICASVCAFEPNPTCANLLKEWGKKKPSVTVHMTALSDKAGIGNLHIPVDNSGIEHDSSASIISRGCLSSRSVSVPVATFDSFGLENIDFIKIDVEGAEVLVLQGATNSIQASKPAMLIEIERRHSIGSFSSVFDLLEDLGYLCFFFDGNLLRTIDEFHLDRDQSLANLGIPKARYINNFLFLHRSRVCSGCYTRLFARWVQR